MKWFDRLKKEWTWVVGIARGRDVPREAPSRLLDAQIDAAIDQGLNAEDLINLCGPEPILKRITAGTIFYDAANERFWHSKPKR